MNDIVLFKLPTSDLTVGRLTFTFYIPACQRSDSPDFKQDGPPLLPLSVLSSLYFLLNTELFFFLKSDFNGPINLMVHSEIKYQKF